MKRFKEDNSQDLSELHDDIVNLHEKYNDANVDQSNSGDFSSYEFDSEDVEVDNEDIKMDSELKTLKVLKDEGKDPYINSSMKRFRLIVGVICLISFIYFGVTNKITKNYMDNLSSGKIENVAVGNILSKDALKLDAKDATIEVSSGYGNLEISIWNFADKEDGDYVQVFIDGVEQGPPFSIRHKPTKISVPDKAVITIQGIRDGSNNGITYAVHFNKTGETYLNTVPLNAMNTYTIISN